MAATGGQGDNLQRSTSFTDIAGLQSLLEKEKQGSSFKAAAPSLVVENVDDEDNLVDPPEPGIQLKLTPKVSTSIDERIECISRLISNSYYN